MMDKRLLNPRFPRANRYNPDWVIAGASGGANPLWLAEWLTEAISLKPGMRVLDLGCGRAMSSIFLHKEFGVQVWATDLWFSASENLRRIRDAGVEVGVFPMHANSRELPYASGFFDAILSIDSFVYYGTDNLYLGNLARLLKPGGVLAISQVGMMQEIAAPVPEHLQSWWEPEHWSMHSAAWWRDHWQKTGIVTVELADSLENGWQYWLDWQHVVCPENSGELDTIVADRGRNLGYIRVVSRRTDYPLHDPIQSIPMKYSPQPLLRP